MFDIRKDAVEICRKKIFAKHAVNLMFFLHEENVNQN